MRLFFNDLPTFYKRILDSFNELKTLYNYYQKQDIVLFNNKEILVGGKPFFFLVNGLKRELFQLKTYLLKSHAKLTFSNIIK